MKKCTKCKVDLDESLFHTDNQKSDKLSSACKECTNKRTTAYRIAQPKKIRETQIKVRAKYHQSGNCRECGKPTLEHSQWYCEEHWYKNKARMYLTGQKDWKLLKELAQRQDFVCPYTRTKLIPSNNMSLDHRIATTKGGTDDLDNLQWVTTEVNLMKRAMDENYFLQLCNLIATYSSSKSEFS